jgi:uncharacterized membrane protein YfcA
LTPSFEPSNWRERSELQQLLAKGLLDGAAVGFVGGLTSGLLGVSPGGALVVFSGLLLGAEQHAAQGISLVAQVFPTSLSGIRRYWQKGHRSPLTWLVLLGVGFLIGGAAGAKAAAAASRTFLQWTFVLYLVALGVLVVVRPPRRESEEEGPEAPPVPRWALATVGAFAGFSSGFLGIGGWLAITVGLSAWLKVPQRSAQMVSLVLLTVPLTIPAAWVYWREGRIPSWPVLLGVVLGLVLGTDIGARLANRFDDRLLRALLIAFIVLMAAYMAQEALR